MRELVGRREGVAGAREDRLEQRGRGVEAALRALELLEHEALEALEAVAALLEDHPAAEGDDRRELTQHEAVARRADHRVVQPDLHQPRPAGGDRVDVQEHDLAGRIRRPGVHAHPHAVLDLAVEARQGS